MAIDPKLIDITLPVPSGYPIEQQREDTRENIKGAVLEAGAIVTDFPNHLWIERKDWKEVAMECAKNRTRPIDYRDRFTNQDPTHECTCHALAAVFEAAWNRQRRIAVGPPVAKQRLEISASSASVWVSPLSVYAEANPGQWGGAGCRQVLNIAARRGFLPDKIQPRDNYGFKHSLHGTCGGGGINQSSGPWTSVSRFPDGWESTGALLKPKEFIFPDSWEQSVCLVLWGYMVGVGRDGHSVPHAEWMPDDEVMAYIDSYDVIRYDSISRIKATIGGSYTVVSTTVPDNWDDPAGIGLPAIAT